MNTAMNNPKSDMAARPEILDDLHVLPGRQLPDEERGANQDHRKPDKAVEHAVANGLAKNRTGDVCDRSASHCGPPVPGGPAPGPVTC